MEHYIDNSVNGALESFKLRRNKKGTISAVKELAECCDKLLDGTSIGEKTYFQDIRVLSEEKSKYVEDVVAGIREEESPILTGIREIDFTMVTGLEKGTLTLFCADVGVFKSSMMLNIGLNVWHQNYDVLFVPLEMHRDQMWRRTMSREARIDSRFLTKNLKVNLNKEHLDKIKRVNEEWKSITAKFFIMQEPGNTTVNKIERLIDRNIEIIRPKLVVIDYVANLEANKNRYGRNDLEIGDMLKAMRQMGKDYDFAVISAAQLGREALRRLRKAGANKDKPTINSEDIRGSHEYAADADNIYAQLKSTAQPNQLLDLFCVKSRNGPTVFEDESIRAQLEVYPAFGLIKSAPLDSEGQEINDIMGDYIDKTEIDKNIINKGSKFFDDEEDDNPVVDIDGGNITKTSFSDDEDVKDIVDSIHQNNEETNPQNEMSW
jgi:archaellum biogenesis ATPase FlaH